MRLHGSSRRRLPHACLHAAAAVLVCAAAAGAQPPSVGKPELERASAEAVQVASEWSERLAARGVTEEDTPPPPVAPEVIRRRMQDNPHPLGILEAKDVEVVLARFEEQFNQSLIGRRVTLDTTNASAVETFASFLSQIERHLSQADQLRILTHQALKG